MHWKINIVWGLNSRLFIKEKSKWVFLKELIIEKRVKGRKTRQTLIRAFILLF